MTDERCECPMSISVLGDGCRYCQPQEYIDRLSEHLEDAENELSTMSESETALHHKMMDLLGKLTDARKEIERLKQKADL